MNEKFKPIFPQIEEKILKFWKERDIFKKSLALRKKGKVFSFYDGPPFASGKPHYGHILATAIKDAVTRYWTMRGYFVPRRVGWDCHGLPVENLIEKELNIKDKKEIEKMGIDKFNAACRASVFRCVSDFQETLKRVGRWADYSNAYATLDNSYIESVWWVFKKLWDAGFIYRDFRVSPYCPRCGTPLSNFEVAQNYKDADDPSVFVKFKIPCLPAGRQSLKFKVESFFLAWTTTPWTLPANAALAVNADFDYVLAEYHGENLILAKERISVLGSDAKIIKIFKGKDLLGVEYEPLFQLGARSAKLKKAHYIVAGDFIGAEDGTGIVHIAPAFGEDDMKIGKKNKLPTLVTVDAEGKMEKGIIGEGLFVKEADELIIGDLEKRGLLFKAEKIKHNYPFCWRCDSPLLYYPLATWYLAVEKLKTNLIENNKEIRWVPAHLKEGRFGTSLKDAPDWAISRNRFWGAPLPIWQCERCGKYEAAGSFKELTKKPLPANNRYFILRHGEAGTNVNGFVSSSAEKKILLTEKGISRIENAAKKLKKQKIDLIFSSPLARTKQTAEIVSEILGTEKIHQDKRLRELEVGMFEGASVEDYHKFYKTGLERFEKRPTGGENLADVRKRMVEFVKETEKNYSGKNILIISHGDPLWILEGALFGLSDSEILGIKYKNHWKEKTAYIKPGEWRKIVLGNVPLDSNGRLDAHRPHIDAIYLKCECGGKMARVEEVFDCWFESGSMPYAQWHYPFENKKLVEKTFPADFIAEGLDQTRGWFYTLHVLAGALTLKNIGLGKNRPAFRNVVVNGLVLDGQGRKLSKKLQNYPEPEEIFNNFGADALRYFLLSSTSIGEDYRFSDKGVEEAMRKIISTFWNTFVFFKTYSADFSLLGNRISKLEKGGNILDKWIFSRLNEAVFEINKQMEAYELTKAARVFEGFLDDLSNWHVRRSRPRFQRPENAKEKKAAILALGGVLTELAKLFAPFAPFISEEVYQGVKNILPGKFLESVHLEKYPAVEKKIIDDDLNWKMKLVRSACALGLKLRAKAGIKVRQPLAELIINNYELKNEKKLVDLIKDELNIKEVKFAEELPLESDKLVLGEEGVLRVALNTEITPALKEEGTIREIIRNIQGMRKDGGFTPSDKIALCYQSDFPLGDLIKRNEKEIAAAVGAKEISRGLNDKKVFKIERDFEMDGEKIWIGVK